jgi:hypothetical protein
MSIQYTVTEINNNVAKIQFSDNSWTFVELRDDMTESELDNLVFMIAPPHLKTGTGTPTFLSEGQIRTAQEMADSA